MIYTKSGFTLIEVMVVLILFALVVTLGMMQLTFLDSTIVHAEVDKFATVCSYMQQKAIASNSDQNLVCDTENNTYRGDNVNETLSSRVCFGFLPNVLGSPGSPTRPINKAVTFADSSIHFFPTGTLSSGTVYLTDKSKKNMYALSNAVSQVSYLRLYRYDGKWKLLDPS
jgi:prepilin-type N-terminal cleavage/methylation domain-containing protein